MSTFRRDYEYVIASRPEHPKGNARRIRILDELISAEALEFLKDIPVLHQGWDMDDWAYLVKYKEKLYILYTNHGQPVVTKDVEGFLTELEKRYDDARAQVSSAVIAFNTAPTPAIVLPEEESFVSTINGAPVPETGTP